MKRDPQAIIKSITRWTMSMPPELRPSAKRLIAAASSFSIGKIRKDYEQLSEDFRLVAKHQARQSGFTFWGLRYLRLALSIIKHLRHLKWLAYVLLAPVIVLIRASRNRTGILNDILEAIPKNRPQAPPEAQLHFHILETGDETELPRVLFWLKAHGITRFNIVHKNSKWAAILDDHDIANTLLPVPRFIGKSGEIDIFNRIHDNLEKMVTSLGTFRYRGASIIRSLKLDLLNAIAKTHILKQISEEALANGTEHIVILAGSNHGVSAVMENLAALKHILNASTRIQTHSFDRAVRSWNEGSNLKGLFHVSKKKPPLLPEQREGMFAQASRLGNSRLWGWLDFMRMQLRDPLVLMTTYFQEYRQKTSQAPVLVVCMGTPDSIYWKGLAPVLEHMRDEGSPFVVLVNNMPTFHECLELGYEVYHLSHKTSFRYEPHLNVTKKFFVQSFGAYAKLASEHDDAKGDIERLFVELLHGNRAFGMIDQHLKYVDLLTLIVDQLQPQSVLLMPHSSPLCRMAAAVAKNRRVPSVSFPTVSLAPHRRSIPINWEVDLLGCYGEHCLDVFEEIGASSGKLVLTGNPAMKISGMEQSEADREQLLAAYGIPKGKKVFLVATSRIDSKEHVWINALLAELHKRDDSYLIVKPHPSYDESAYEEINNRYSDHFNIITDAAVHDLLMLCDVIITDYSTTGAEGALLGKPVMVMNLLETKYPSNNYDEMGIGILITKTGQIPRAVWSILEDDTLGQAMAEARQLFSDQYNWKNDGRAHERIAHMATHPDEYLTSPNND